MIMRIKIEKNNLFLIYLLLFAQISTLGVLNGIVLGGRPISAYIRYVVFFLTFLNLILCIFDRPKLRPLCIYFFISFVMTSFIGYFKYGNLMVVLIEASHYVTVISLYFWALRHDYSVEKLRQIIYIIIPVLLTTSILSSFGYLRGLNDVSGGLLRNSVDVDGTIGVVTTLFCFHEINRKVKALLIDYVEFIMGCLIVAFSISRGRIAILILCFALYILVSFRCRKVSRFKKLLPLILLFLVLFILFSKTVGGLFNQILVRFKSSSGDVNLIRRTEEIGKHLSILYDNLFFGAGFGMLIRYGIYDHCSYTAVLAYMGIINGIPYLLWFVIYLFKSFVQCLKAQTIGKYHLSFIMFFAIMCLAFANMSFNKTGGVWGMLIAYTSLLHYDYDLEAKCK